MSARTIVGSWAIIMVATVAMVVKYGPPRGNEGRWQTVCGVLLVCLCLMLISLIGRRLTDE